MEMPAPESRRDSLEASFNDSIMDGISFNNENLNATLDMSQVSGWSAMTPGWNDSFKISLFDGESEEASDRVSQQNQEQERLVGSFSKLFYWLESDRRDFTRLIDL